MRETTPYAHMERRTAGHPSTLTFTALLCYHGGERSPAAQVTGWQRKKDLRKGKGFRVVMRDRALGGWMTSLRVIALDSQAGGHVLLAGVCLGRLHGLGLVLVLNRVPWSSCTDGSQQLSASIMADKLVYAFPVLGEILFF